MSAPAIEASRLSKRYRLGQQREKYRMLRETVSQAFHRPFHRRPRGDVPGTGARADAAFWALRDVSFEVAPGEVVGVIGRNGAGKSTLLKVLSRITTPTAGFAEIRGRIGSLLEVGTGFHQELSGRENLFLSGAILGMRRAQITRKLDEIVAFAEVEQFVDTPVKHYSSGMYLRLAFAVAAFLEPEVLLVDEVLAVGDLAFQRRCLGKMGDVAADGRTVLFVSHNLGAVRDLCGTSLVLDNGHLVFRGSASAGTAFYARSSGVLEISGPQSSGWRQVAVNGQSTGVVGIERDQPLEISALLAVDDRIRRGHGYCIIEDGAGRTVIHERVVLEGHHAAGLAAGVHRFALSVSALWLAAGAYTVYFKLIGHTGAGPERRIQSERVLIEVAGWTNERASALLAPRTEWHITLAEPGRPSHGPTGPAARGGPKEVP
jgi:ABC-type polysaccharide/polyol phosphate transport system ATPase subunit